LCLAYFSKPIVYKFVYFCRELFRELNSFQRTKGIGNFKNGDFMRKVLLLVGLIAYTCIAFSQFSPKEQIAYSRYTSPDWMQVIKDGKGNASLFNQKMLNYAKENRPLAKMPNNGYSKEDSVVFFQNSQLWLAYNPYFPPFVAYSKETTKENPEADLSNYLKSIEVWKANNKEKWSTIEQAVKTETGGDYPTLEIKKDKQQSYNQYEEKLLQWQKQNPWYAEVLMKAHLEQVKRQLGL